MSNERIAKKLIPNPKGLKNYPASRAKIMRMEVIEVPNNFKVKKAQFLHITLPNIVIDSEVI